MTNTIWREEIKGHKKSPKCPHLPSPYTTCLYYYAEILRNACMQGYCVNSPIASWGPIFDHNNKANPSLTRFRIKTINYIPPRNSTKHFTSNTEFSSNPRRYKITQGQKNIVNITEVIGVPQSTFQLCGLVWVGIP